MNKKITISLLIAVSLLSFFLTIINFRIPSPPAFNADEAAFGYNAYSLLKTGRDEYGALLPLRLKSFGDFKMPLYSYLSVPFIAAMGLNATSARALNAFLSLFLPLVVYLLTKELFKKDSYGIVAALLTATSLGLHIVSRHAHEGYLAAFLTTSTFYLLVRLLKKMTIGRTVLFSVSLLLMLFSYHPGRLFAGLFFLVACMYAFQQKKVRHFAPLLVLIVTLIALFSISDIFYKPERLKSLLFFSSSGIQLKVEELKTEGGIRYLYHPLLVGVRDMTFEHLSYFSPQFLLQNGDSNDRFGFKGMGLITPIEYILFFAGLYFLINKREEWRHILLFILFFSPLSASLSWATSSLTRSLFLLIPISIVASYGIVNIFSSQKKSIYSTVFYLGIISLFCFYSLAQWDLYIFHYPRRLTTINSWQSGYKELIDYTQKEYGNTDAFYITKDLGMPYIFLLFYTQYPPERYQQQAELTAPDEYGFGQVERFDKYIFTFKKPSEVPDNSVIVGSKPDMQQLSDSEQKKVHYIEVNGEPMFGIYKK